ncbi:MULTISPECIES: hypothetical protein [Streptomyces]|uniref:Transmembrane protein n=1 Tax=Streptomyces salyersiae TaxID=3075530 RepID=A0ABU2RDT0_9ACTN|nr:hypothetical protein [Streptomyces sp. DSM 41770]MDT0426630.1 hypothetical protein [Streptomyces sp. DSM 41770]
MRSREYDLQFRDRAARIRTWGLILLSLAALLWIWCAVLLMMPYEADTSGKTDYRSPAHCEARLFTDRGTANHGLQEGNYCANERDWPEALAVLGASVPLSTVGVGLFTIGTVTRRMSAHGEAMRELDKLAEGRDG